MSLSHIVMLNNEFLNKDPDLVLEQAPLVISDIKSAVCMSMSYKDIKHIIHIFIIMHFVINDEECNV